MANRVGMPCRWPSFAPGARLLSLPLLRARLLPPRSASASWISRLWRWLFALAEIQILIWQWSRLAIRHENIFRFQDLPLDPCCSIRTLCTCFPRATDIAPGGDVKSIGMPGADSRTASPSGDNFVSFSG